jgi:hypothetical protein
MHTLDIYRGQDIFVTIKPEKSSAQYKGIMAENELRLTFFLDHSAEFDLNDYTTVYGEVYKINTLPVVEKISNYRYSYSLTMESESFDLKKAQFLFLGPTNQLTNGDFALLATPQEFLELLVQNVNRVNEGWSIGQSPLLGAKNILFKNANCLEALTQLAAEFDTEYFLEGKVIHLSKRLRSTGNIFRYGKDRGLVNIRRSAVDNSTVITRLYAFGSDKNLPFNYRNGANRLQFGNIPYYDYNTQRYGVIEGNVVFDEIYPNRTGQVTAVSNISPYRFNDSTIDFNVSENYLPGVNPQLTFNTGQLAGYTFEIKRFDNDAKEFTILKNPNEKALDLPNNDIRPAIGDKYVLTEISLPASYIANAETRLLARAVEYIKEVGVPRVTYQVSFDKKYLRRNSIELNIGDTARVIDEHLSLDRNIRIVTIIRNLIEEQDYTIELSDSTKKNIIRSLSSGISSNSRDIENIYSNLGSNAVLNKRFSGDVIIEQGTMQIPDMEQLPANTGHAILALELATGRIFFI